MERRERYYKRGLDSKGLKRKREDKAWRIRREKQSEVLSLRRHPLKEDDAVDFPLV
jgi:hypothetical protein